MQTIQRYIGRINKFILKSTQHPGLEVATINSFMSILLDIFYEYINRYFLKK
jgi:hypothetical protein